MEGGPTTIMEKITIPLPEFFAKKCLLCASHIYPYHPDSLYEVSGGYICENCVRFEAAKWDRTVFPWNDHMRDAVESYIQWRCDVEVSKFVLDQAERI